MNAAEGEINIVLCFDECVLKPAEVAICSAVRHCSMPVTVSVLTTVFSPSAEAELRLMCQLLGVKKFAIYRIDLRSRINVSSTNSKIPIEAYLNFFIFDCIVPIDQAIYLDADVYVKSDLAKLWRKNMKGNLVLGSDKSWAHADSYLQHTGLSRDDIYINNGVMLLNVGELRRENFGNRLIAAANKYGERMPCMDQDVFNIELRGRIGALDCSWNFTTFEYNDRPLDRFRAHIHHYTATPKPWQKSRDYSWRDHLWKNELGLVEKMLARNASCSIMMRIGLLARTFAFVVGKLSWVCG